MQKRILITTLFILSLTGLYAGELEDGYKSLISNDHQMAFQHFKAATQIAETKAEAYLMLALIQADYEGNEAAFNYFLNFYKNCPDADIYASALFTHKSVAGSSSLKTKKQLNWLQEIVKKEDVNTTLKANAHESLAKHYSYTYNLKAAKTHFQQIGAITEWQIVGDFENISASGFDKDYAPIAHPEPQAVFKNKVDADVKWFSLFKPVPGKWIDFTRNFNCNNTMVFAQTFCNTIVDQDVFLRIGTSGSLKLWVNDQLLFQEQEERNNGIDTYTIPVHLFRGNNRILLQIGSSKIEQCNFMVRATDIAGNPMQGLTFSDIYKAYNKNTQKMPAPLVSKTETYLRARIAENPEKLVNYFVLANALLMNDKIHEAKEILLKAQGMAPDCSYLLNQLIELYARDGSRTQASLTLEKIKIVDPESPMVLALQINDLLDAENYSEARKKVELKEKLYGVSSDLFVDKMRLVISDKDFEGYEKLLNQAASKYPDNYDFVELKYNFALNYKKDMYEVINLLKNFTKKHLHTDALASLSEAYFKAGLIREGTNILKDFVEYFPYSDGSHKALGMFYLQMSNYSQAKQYLENCIKIAPYFGPYHGNLARVYEGMGDKKHAISEYQLNILYSPSDYDAIVKLRNLQSKKDVFKYFPEKDYYKLFENSPTEKDYPSDNIISLADDRQVVLYENGGCEIRHCMLYKALTLKGIDNLKEYWINSFTTESYSIEKAEVLKKNGNRLQAEVNDNHIVYTSLEPGDAVYLIYKKKRYVTGQMTKQFYEKWLLNDWYPTLDNEYHLLVANGVKFDFVMTNSELKPEITDADDFKLYTWKKTNTKSLPIESYMPSMEEIGELLSISTIPDWDYIAKWYYDISFTKSKADTEIIEKVNELLKGKESLTQIEKARIFYNYIQKTIRYSSVSFRQSGTVPQKASEVLITRIGDCKDLAILFNSMCSVAGIKTNMVLVSRRENGNSADGLPSFDFDHAISKAELDGKPYYIELTSSYLPFATLGESLINASVLEVNNDPQVKVVPITLRPETRQPNNSFREVTASFDGDNLIQSVSTKRTGMMAVGFRYFYRDLGNDERLKELTKSLSSDYSNIKLSSLNIDSSLYNCSDTLRYSYTYVAPRVFTKIQDLSIVKIPLNDRLSPMQFLSPEERIYPITAWSYSTFDTICENVTIEFPANKTIAEIPKSVHYSCNQADYSMTFSVNGRTLYVTRKMVNKLDTVPISDYATYRSFIESVVNADNLQIGFK